MPEVLSLHIGQTGVQIGRNSWELYCLEHGFQTDGTLSSGAGSDATFRTFFRETEQGKYFARAIFLDLEPTYTDNVRTGKYGEMFHHTGLVSGQVDAAYVYARGRYSMGRELIDLAVERIRKNVEQCDDLQGFLLYRSYGGGTGSGYTSLVLEQLTELYGKKTKFDFSVFPGDKTSIAMTDPYNSVLSAHDTLQHSDCAFLLDNQAIYDICQQRLGLEIPSFSSMNQIIGQVISAISAPLRFSGDSNVSLEEMRANLVTSPRLKFPVTSYAPIFAPDKVDQDQMSVSAMTNACFEPANQMIKCGDLDQNKYMGLNVMYRGDVGPKDVNDAIEAAKSQRTIQGTASSKTSITSQLPAVTPGGDLASVQRAVCMLSNTTAIADAWARLTRKYDIMYSKRAFLHWYTRETMAESEFRAAREDLAALQKEYEEMKSQ